ncbi:MAG: DUF882 domain-containing protein [Xanthobacteraceae bacterium]|nr:DUF882 domain-containing protein [Xanthobacteraceae bacterium]
MLLSRAGYGAGLTSLLLLAGAGSVHDATASRQTRTLSFHHTHSGEDLTITYKRNGRYDEAALKQLNHFLRDWRNQAQTTMDPHLFDILWEVYRDVDGTKPIQIISSYRSPATNAMLRRRSAHTGVARHSQHMLGRAMDFFIPGVALEKIRFAGLRLQRGGVGFYPTSGSPFVHLDTGSIRHWPRMTHDQLARVFPDGRTVHVPSDGKPLAGYQLALADIQKRGKEDDGFAFQKPKNLFAALFKSKTAGDEDDEAPAASAATPAAARPAPATVVAEAQPAASADPVPLPRAKPAVAASYQVASAERLVPPAPIPVTAESEPRFKTPADIINSRGFWGDTPPTKPKQATPAQVAAITARQALSNAVDPQTTASIDHAFHALAYAPAPSPVDRAHIVAASAPIPRHTRPRSAAHNPMAVNDVTTVVTKGRQGRDGRVTVSTRLAAATKTDTVWMRAMILSPSATTAMSSTVFGEPDMTTMRTHFVKPRITVAASFGDNPQSGMVCDRFTGSAVASLPTVTFQTAALR